MLNNTISPTLNEGVLDNSNEKEPPINNALVKPSAIRDICKGRDKALEKMKKASKDLEKKFQTAVDIENEAKIIHGNTEYPYGGRCSNEDYKSLFGGSYNQKKAIKVYREKLDASIWTFLIRRFRLGEIMDTTAKKELESSLALDVPEITYDNVMATINGLLQDSDLIFKRGLAKAFSDLDRRFKSHDGFKLGSRIILDYVFDNGRWSYHSYKRDMIIDIERVFAVLNGSHPRPGELFDAVDRSRGNSWGPRQSVTETRYFKVKGYKNGNAHLWFNDDRLVEKANKILHEFYGEVLPDGVSREDDEQNLNHKTKLPSKDLQFYPTPQAVVDKILREAYFSENAIILEPSAGEGAFIPGLAKKAGKVHAIEINEKRIKKITDLNLKNVETTCANFLCMPAQPIYDGVVMNPPFYGTHWINHIYHAFKFLKPGGTLFSVLPISAELGETKDHLIFRKWAEKFNPGFRGLFQDLPPESFVESGTRINTVIIKLRKPQ